MQVKCKLLAIDMEGKADGRALRSILPLIEPKKLVLINGDVEATQDLADALQAGIMDSENVFMPSVGDKVKIADVTKSFSVRLDDSLMTALALRKVRHWCREEHARVLLALARVFADRGHNPFSIPCAMSRSTNTRSCPSEASLEHQTSRRSPF